MEAEPVGFLFLFTILNWAAIKIQSFFYLRFISFLKKPSVVSTYPHQLHQNRGGGVRVSREEAELVVESLGLLCGEGGEQLKEEMGTDDFCSVFEEREPSLEETREAFSVFDENRDGFIDAGELQRVLALMGFKQGLGLEGCEGIIGGYDENGDGLIDFDEFVKLLESSFC
ncbi:uncharacterized protein A4U43_C07F35370 [Asparagus officinalis]|uniref:EF-hand domain-containing protein n=1 Tax=Asparagus officinalis TaxID=4686 RepID=A0A5P1EH82_ASPOF|nr:probable calcium-binding protein CML30 [Asparagus officinalis]ONK65266.1 uncharacterized protein A4U43_C07F35370 [Asparagus officinalis]